ncbi:XRE family transcriptional regulator [Amycolatopsis orientalis]|uniref:XRE family transcriptional regulator n=1 Tax=Amycolatopsis orientalis TaxID=31958 RepID=A0A193BVF5_AMYOR|nr:helix-turn-helix domain-containing protein [Amycolatopsis orientalis]ANN16154.1 XRE family transcriptional regulator [Amycolatopsis orientalis]
MTNAARGENAPTFKALLKGHRVRAGLTQEELAEGSGVSVRAISDMERGIAKGPQRRTIESLAGPLSLTDEELITLQKVAKQSRAQPAAAPAPAPAGIYGSPLIGVLPADVDDLTGREHDLGALRTLVADLGDGRRRAGRVAVLSGPPGTGKTTLAVRTAHDLAADFPDGRLFLKLRGMSSEPNEPADVLHVILRSLGVDAVRIPADLEDRVSLCRSLLQDRATLIVLDDAADEAQVRPLLVGGPRCLTLISSRQMLVGLEGASRHSLDVLGEDEAVALLSAIIGSGRVGRERSAALELVHLCGRLPLALRIAGNRLASRPTWPLSRLVEQLRDRSRRLTTLTAGDLTVRGVFELSYRQLTPAAAMVFRRLAVVPAADFSVGAAMTLIEAQEEDDAALFLEELADASLLQTSQENGRYQFHDLLRVFAMERLTQEETPDAVEAAENRLADWLVRTATAAGHYFQPSDGMSPPPVPTPSFDDHAGAGRWLEVERANWLAAVKSVAARGDHRPVLDLSDSMHWYSEIGGTASTWYDVFALAADAAVAIGGKREEAVHRNYLAWVLTTLCDQPDEAAKMARRAWDAAVEAGDRREQAWARVYLSSAHLRGGELKESAALFDDAVRLFEEAGYPLGLHVARAMRGTYLYRNGQFDDAAVEFEACVRYFEQGHDGTSTPVDETTYAYLLLRSAQNLTALGSADLALAQYETALALFYRHGAAMGQGRALQETGKLLRGQGDPAGARDRLTRALAVFERIGLTQSQVDTLCDRAALSDEQGDPASARGDRERALSLCDRLGRSEGAKFRERLTGHLNAS